MDERHLIITFIYVIDDHYTSLCETHRLSVGPNAVVAYTSLHLFSCLNISSLDKYHDILDKSQRFPVPVHS